MRTHVRRDFSYGRGNDGADAPGTGAADLPLAADTAVLAIALDMLVTAV